MSVVLFRHSRVRVPELRGYYTHWNTAHGERARIGVAQNVKSGGWLDLSPHARVIERPPLMGLSPGLAVVASKEELNSPLTGSESVKQRNALVCERYVTRLSGFRLAYRDRSSVRIEVARPHPRELAVSTTC
jgi:hypothetical protein